LDERGVSEASRERYFLGAAPSAGDALVQHFRRKRYDLRVAERIGLVGLRGGSAYDRFRGRLMFPIRDSQGRTLGFGARRIGDGDGPKYLNSSDSPVYHKGRVLYGLFEWRESERKPVQAAPQTPAQTPPRAPAQSAPRDSELILVEGYLDVIAMSQAGIANVVAGCGTALTSDQARLVRRHAGDVVALFDGDDAGRRAAARSFPVFLEAALWARGVFLPQSEDPDTFVRRNGASALRSEIAAAKPLVESYVRYVAEGASGPGATARVGAELATVLRKVENPFEYDDFVRKASLWTGISERVLREQARPEQKPSVRAPQRSISIAAGPPTAEELLVSVLLSDAGCVDRLEKRDIVGHLHTEPWATIAADIFAARDSTGGFVPGDILAELDGDLRSRIVARLQGDPTFGDADGRQTVLADCLKRLAGAAFERSKKRMLLELRRLEEIGDDAGAAALLERWNRMKSEKVR